MKTATVQDFRHHLSKLLEELKDGEEIVITRRGEAVGKLVPMREERELAFPDFAKVRANLGTDRVTWSNEVLAQRGETP